MKKTINHIIVFIITNDMKVYFIIVPLMLPLITVLTFKFYFYQVLKVYIINNVTAKHCVKLRRVRSQRQTAFSVCIK